MNESFNPEISDNNIENEKNTITIARQSIDEALQKFQIKLGEQS